MTQPVVTIEGDYGGSVIEHVEQVEEWRKEGTKVEIDGVCASACTLALGLGPDKVCATPVATLGFHKASGAWGTANLLHAYSAKVRAWLDRRGGLTERVLWTDPEQTETLVGRCPKSAGPKRLR